MLVSVLQSCNPAILFYSLSNREQDSGRQMEEGGYLAFKQKSYDYVSLKLISVIISSALPWLQPMED